MADIIVIGAGPAGLYTSLLLSEKHNVTLIEAAPFAGGRIRTFYGGNIIEGGAEFIHGSQQITMNFVEEAGLNCHPYPGAFFRNNGNGPEPSEMVDGFDKVLKLMKESRDITLVNFLDLNPLPKNLQEQLVLLSKNFSLANPAEVSVQYLADDWGTLDEEQFFIEEGYGAVINHLLRRCEINGVNILYNCRADKIEWSFGNVKIFTPGKVLEATKTVITVPINRIGKSPGIDITFNDEIRNALNCFGYGPTIKCIFEFKEPFWKEQGFFLSDEEFATWWTHPKYANRLTGWMDEDNAAKTGTNEQALMNTALMSISKLFGVEMSAIPQNVQLHRFFNWQSGAYSFGKPGFAEARKLLGNSLDETIFFAGEAFQDKVTDATVEAAFVSAKNAAGMISS